MNGERVYCPPQVGCEVNYTSLTCSSQPVNLATASNCSSQSEKICVSADPSPVNLGLGDNWFPFKSVLIENGWTIVLLPADNCDIMAGKLVDKYGVTELLPGNETCKCRILEIPICNKGWPNSLLLTLADVITCACSHHCRKRLYQGTHYRSS